MPFFSQTRGGTSFLLLMVQLRCRDKEREQGEKDKKEEEGEEKEEEGEEEEGEEEEVMAVT